MSSHTIREFIIPDDVDLLASFVHSGSQDDFSALVERHSAMVLDVCRRMLGNADAEDAAQAVFVLLWQKAKRLKRGTILAGWLHRTAHHVSCNALRSRKSRHRLEQTAAMELTSMNNDSSTIDQWSEVRRILDEEVNRLPDKLRVPFVLFHLENRSLAEVAEAVGSSVSTVGTWLQRSRARLADRLRLRGVAVGAAAFAAILSKNAVSQAAPPAFVASAVQLAAGFGLNGAAAAAHAPAVAMLVKAGAVGTITKTTWIVSCVLVAVVIGFPIALFWFGPLLKTRQSTDFPLLQGEWRQVAHEQDGKPMDVTPGIEFTSSLVISGQQFRRYQTLSTGKVIEGEHGRFELESSANPKVIDFKLLQGTARGIYQIDGDTLTLCITKNGDVRPAQFATAYGDDRTLTKYQKEK